MHSSSSLQSNTISVLGETQRLVLEQQNQTARICGYSSMVSHDKEDKSISTNDDTAVDTSGDGAAVCPPPLPCCYSCHSGNKVFCIGLSVRSNLSQ